MTTQEIKEAIKKVGTTEARNSMDCSENWYDVYWAIKQTFTEEEIDDMNARELNYLIRLGDAIAEGLY